MKAKHATDAHIAELLECLEKGEHRQLLDRAWELLYAVLIPFRTAEVYQLLPAYMVILRQTLRVPAVSEESHRILSIVDLIIHPRRNSIVDYRECAPPVAEE